MSQWKFGNFETEIDFTDVDFLDRIDEGKQLMQEAENHVLKVGKNSDIIRSQCEVFYAFFDHVFGREAREAMFEGKTRPLRDANCSFDANNNKTFSAQIARAYWTEDMTFGNLVYVPNTEFGGIIGNVLTSTALDYVELKGYTWRGQMDKKIIQPPNGQDYKRVSGELNTVLKALVEPEFDGLYVVPTIDTGVSVSNYQFDRYCTLLDGLTKMLSSKGYRLDIRHRREQGTTGYISVCAVPIQDYSKEIELSKDSGLTYTMDDKRNGVNHLIVAGKGELQERNVLHLYVHPDGSIKKTQYYKGLDEIAEVYENTSTETAQLESQSKDKLLELCSKKTFGMDIDRLGLEVSIGDIVGGRDYLTGMYMAKPIENIIYEVTNRMESKIYELEGENEE